MIIDRISNSNALSHVNPTQKFVLSIGAIVILLFSENYYVYFFNLFVFNYLLLFKVKVKPLELMKLYSIPVFFTLSSSFVLVLSGADWRFFVVRTICSISSIYFFICSTPVTDIDYVFQKMRAPLIFRELFLLIYKYIFALLDNKNKIVMAQESRLGYRNYKISLNSFSMLVTSILKKTYYYSYNSAKAMESRLGNKFLFQNKNYRTSNEFWFLMGLFFIVNILVEVYGA
jgi:cobalt/nickel transport system permease protein